MDSKKEALGQLLLGKHEFNIVAASFRYITQSWSGSGWDFNFSGPCINDNLEEPVFPYGVGLLAEAAPLPLAKAVDYSNIELVLPMSYDEKSGEPFFGINIWEEFPVSDVRIKFIERDGKRYLIKFTGIAEFNPAERFELLAWAEELPDHAYPV